MNIQQEIRIHSSAIAVYEALTNAKQFTELTGAPAEIVAKEGGKFTCFGGMITGQTIELEPSKLLVQAWRPGNWGKGVYSIVRFEFEGVEKTKTKIIFEHSGFPPAHKAHLEIGWYDNYWKPLKKYLEK